NTDPELRRFQNLDQKTSLYGVVVLSRGTICEHLNGIGWVLGDSFPGRALKDSFFCISCSLPGQSVTSAPQGVQEQSQWKRPQSEQELLCSGVDQLL
ncbi:hypothetical protein BgiMline_002183, partial [Biomphalaria glabrata]